ncbi:MAG: HNH endonuclease, partial [Actinobacteria bacterium]|nr:HNH endonuclease [Actinomycetota bacterium]
APVSWCDAHHLIHWAKGGETNLHNLVLLCRTHHTRIHKLHPGDSPRNYLRDTGRRHEPLAPDT